MALEAGAAFVVPLGLIGVADSAQRHFGLESMGRMAIHALRVALALVQLGQVAVADLAGLRHPDEFDTVVHLVAVAAVLVHRVGRVGHDVGVAKLAGVLRAHRGLSTHSRHISW